MDDITTGQVRALTAHLDGREGIDAIILDEIVYDAATQAASKANDGGAEAQATFLITHLGYDKAIALIDQYA